MKAFYAKAGIPTARYHLVENFEEASAFAHKVGYPVIVKPDNGVGANNTYKLKCDEDVEFFIATKDDNIYILDEVYVFEKETAEIIPLAENIPKNKQMWCDSAEPDRIKMWKKAGFKAKGVDKGGSAGSVKAQIDWLKQRKIYVHPSCVNTIKELQQWKWKKDEKTGEYLDDPVPIMDDAMAALRYGVEGWRKQTKWLY